MRQKPPAGALHGREPHPLLAHDRAVGGFIQSLIDIGIAMDIDIDIGIDRQICSSVGTCRRRFLEMDQWTTNWWSDA